MDGYLPPELLQLPALEVLDLSYNMFAGPLPPQWTSQTLRSLNLANNVLSGPLPPSYGAPGAFPALKELNLRGNLLVGALPVPAWTTGFSPKAVITLRPGNDGLCGAVPLVNPVLLTSGILGTTPADTLAILSSLPARVQPTSSPTGGGDAYGTDVDADTPSQVYIMHQDVLAQNTSVLITNTLGSCAEPCGRAFMVETNILDATWQYNVTIADLIANNPGLTPAEAKPGTQLALPCYPEGSGTPMRFSSDAAAGMFAGGNEKGMAGVVGAELAGAVVSPSGLVGTGVYYEGSMAGPTDDDGDEDVDDALKNFLEGGGFEYVKPVYWFVKMDATFTVSAVTVTAGEAMENVSLWVGTNVSDYASNTPVHQSLAFAAGESKTLPVDHILGKLVILNAGTSPLSLAHARVWPAEANAALNKPVIGSGAAPREANSSVDGSLSTCATFRSDRMASGGSGGTDMGAAYGGDEDAVWVGVDLGYEAQVTVVSLTLGSDTGDASRSAQVFVTADSQGSDALSNATACALPSDEAGADRPHHAATDCGGLVGRYVSVRVTGRTELSVCEIEVFVDEAPTALAPYVESSSVVGIAVGCALGGAALALAVVGGVVYWRRRKRAQRAAAGKTSPEVGLAVLSDAEAMEAGKAAGVRHDSITSGAGAPLGASGLMRRWAGISWTGSDQSGRSSPTKIGATDGLTPSTDLSKFTDGCDIVDFRDIELVRTIGEGSFGLVWMARYLQTTVAVKVLTHDLKRADLAAGLGSSAPSEEVMNALQREASIMAALRHPNCIQYLGAALNPPALIMEYCSKRSVDTILAAATLDPKLSRQLDWVHLLSMACDAAKGMLYLHTRSPPIVHRDLKSPNLLVDGLWHVKVSDFNLSRALEHNTVASSLQITNPRWLAPEVLKGGMAGTAADVYSFGVVLWELLTWRLPWGNDTNPFAIINSVGEGATLPVPPQGELPAGPLSCYDAYVALMRRCWARDPDERPTMDEVAALLRGMLTGLVQGRLESAGTADKVEDSAEPSAAGSGSGSGSGSGE
jgi:hypothetical protein